MSHTISVSKTQLYLCHTKTAIDNSKCVSVKNYLLKQAWGNVAPDFFDIDVSSQKCIRTTFQKVGDCDITDTPHTVDQCKGWCMTEDP